jgi:phosphopantothenoylcysteine decarboxylase/phosphopantothenate--cysteine ligase
MLKGKKILLGITASIAAYKSILLLRLLVKAGAEVKVVMTPAAKEFVSPLVLSTLSGHPVVEGLADNHQWSNHVMLGRWADIMVIAPLTCNTLAKMAHGLCDNMLLATYLSATCPVLVVPAMDEDMWLHASTKQNLAKIDSYGNKVLEVQEGYLASGLTGKGRMAEPEEILHQVAAAVLRSARLEGKKVLITAGPTYEAIDPVRFIGNHSSGKMGFALAEQAFLQGADVEVISGPTAQVAAYPGIKVTRVQSAEEMYQAVMEQAAAYDVLVMSAAVADYTPREVSSTKIKKGDRDDLVVHLKKTKDILKTVGENKKPGQLVVGFALETDEEEANALKKLKEKKADLIILNSLQDAGAGFGTDTNKITVFGANSFRQAFPLQSKQETAASIIELIIKQMHEKA